jgi:hypothetical protein
LLAGVAIELHADADDPVIPQRALDQGRRPSVIFRVGPVDAIVADDLDAVRADFIDGDDVDQVRGEDVDLLAGIRVASQFDA